MRIVRIEYRFFGMEETTIIVNIIKDILEDEGRSQRWMAKKVGIHPTTLNGYINNERQIPGDVLYKMAKALNRTMDSLMEEKIL